MRRWNKGADAAIATAVKVEAIEKHMVANNGIVGELVRRSHVQEGWMQAMGAIMAVALLVGSVVGIIESLSRWA